jgi:tripartite-type tricarboxylate transporter receptor subunit TctC
MNNRPPKTAATGPKAKVAAALACLVVAASLLTSPSPSRADAVADFYKGKTLTILVGQEPGTGFDIYSRTLARHLGRHIPGSPSIVVQNMPGASGVNAFNWLFNIAAKDGSVMGTASQNVVMEPLFGNAAAKYDATKFFWIGNMEESASVCGVSPEAKVERFEDLLSREVVFGATGPTGPLGQAARALNQIVGTKLKIIYGYKGSATVKLAIAKGEVQGICGLPWSTIKAFWKDDLDTKRFKPIIQLSAKRLPELGPIAHIDDHVKTPEARQLVELIFGQLVLGRIYAAPPGVPDERIAALRKAFMATMSDKEFRADAEKTRIDILPATGEQVGTLIRRFYAFSPAVVALAKQTVDAK